MHLPTRWFWNGRRNDRRWQIRHWNGNGNRSRGRADWIWFDAGGSQHSQAAGRNVQLGFRRRGSDCFGNRVGSVENDFPRGAVAGPRWQLKADRFGMGVKEQQ